ncbi:clostripain [Bacteroidia bacterium]|nr:clostripain [Bacteroidia bacterium]
MKKICLILGALALLASCEGDHSEPVAVRQVLLVYLGGNSNLSWESYGKLDAIRQGWNGAQDTKILIYHDPANATPSLQELVRKKGENVAEVVASYEEENSASAEVFGRVIQTVKNRYEAATSYGLLVFSHGTGWLPPTGMYANPRAAATRSIVVDGGAEMDIIDMAAAIPDGLFDHIVFEACLMANIEVVYEFRNKAKYILAAAAEIVSPGFTPIYPASVNKLLGGYAGLQSFAQDAFDYFSRQSGWEQSATFSIIHTAALGELKSFVAANADFSKPIDSDALQDFTRKSYHLFFDFGDYYSRLTEAGRQPEFARLMGEVVPWKASTPWFLQGSDGGFKINAHSGLTTYIVQPNFPQLNAAYEKLQWTQSFNN